MRGRNSIWGAIYSRNLAMRESREVMWETNRDDVSQRRTSRVRDTRACLYVDDVLALTYEYIYEYICHHHNRYISYPYDR